MNDFAELAALLVIEITKQSWLNAYLLGVGMSQIVEDYLYADGYFLRRAVPYLGSMHRPFGPLAAGLALFVEGCYVSLRNLNPRIRQVASWHMELSKLVEQLALLVVDHPDVATRQELQSLGQRSCQSAEVLPARVRRAVIRLPSCFRSFDQRPADLELLVRRFRDREPDLSTPIAVVGVRTSGSYLAPLIGALLNKHGFRDVRVLTMRPGYPVPSSRRSLLQTEDQRGRLVLLTDDPPTTGYSLSLTAGSLRRFGVPARAIVVLLQLFTSEEVLPAALASYQSVLLRWNEWAVHEQMQPSAIRVALTGLLAPNLTVGKVERLPLTHCDGVRGHAQGLYRVELTNSGSGQAQWHHIYVTGVGLGYFGDHSLAIARSMRDLVPQVYGISDGMLFRAWMPEEQRLSVSQLRDQPSSLKPLIDYVRARRSALPCDEDKSLRLIGRQPVWEVASNIVSRAFGPAWFLVRIPLVDPLVKRIMRVQFPSIVDGSMAPSRWFTTDTPKERVIKVDFERRAFSHLDLYCYDSIYDLAGLGIDLEVASLAEGLENDLPGHLRQAAESVAGENIDPERWLLHQLVHLWDLRRSSAAEPAVRRAGARALQRYFEETFFTDATPSSKGAICGLDLDGVRETEPVGFATLTRSSALALRALLRHGYQPVLVTGRSLAEVRERCGSYRLAGGVAEYGAAVYNHRTGRVQETINDRSCYDLDRLREALQGIEGVCLDGDHRYSVRAYEVGGEGRRRGLPATLIEHVLSDCGLQGSVLPISGDSQTDFVASSVNKGTGLRVLAADLGGRCDVEHDKPLALAVGDTVSDVPFFSLAKLAAVPRHADERARQPGVRVLKRKYQAGLAEAVSLITGHPPGGCDVCRWRPSVESRTLLTILGAQEQGIRSMMTAVVLLAVRNSVVYWRGSELRNRVHSYDSRDK